MKHGKPNRRQLLQMGAAVGGSLLAGQKTLALETDPRKLGEPLGPYSERSPFEKAVRWRRDSKTPETGSSFTPLHDSVGILTPSALHYERHHSGVPTIDPAEHRLVVRYAGDMRLVGPVDLVPRMRQLRGKVAVVGEQQQPLRVVVETSNRVDVFLHRLQ